MSDDQKPSFLDKLNSGFAELWEKDKLFVIIFGALILVIKFRDILIDILLNSAKSVEDKAKKQDDKLSKEETDAKAQADALVKKADEAPSTEKPVDDDWFKKKP